MNATYLEAVEAAAAAEGADLITHIGLFDDGDEVSGGSPAYARLAVTWDQTGGTIRPDANLDFDIPAGATVDEWRGFDAATGGTDYGGAPLSPAVFSAQGVYRLVAAQTSIPHTATVPA